MAGSVATAAEQPVTGEALARRLISSQGCRACHQLEGRGATLGPTLQGVGQRLDRAAIRRQLVNPEQRHGDGRLPDFHHLSTTELDALVNFLAGQQ